MTRFVVKREINPVQERRFGTAETLSMLKGRMVADLAMLLLKTFDPVRQAGVYEPDCYVLDVRLTDEAEPKAFHAEIAFANERLGKAIDLLKRLEDVVEALDGTSIENERIVDDYRAFMQSGAL